MSKVLNSDGSVLGTYILSGAFGDKPAPEEGWPVVLVYHGGSENAQEILDYSQLGSLEAVVISLQGQAAYNKLSWMNAFIWLKSSTDGDGGLPRNDVQFTELVLQDVARRHSDLPLDRSRIYATGKSDGAGMAVFLAAHPELRSFDLRAIAPISGAYFGIHEFFVQRSFTLPPTGLDYHDIILASNPIPLLEMHGDADTVMPYEGQRDRKALEHYYAGESFWATTPGFDVDENGVPLAHTANIPDYWQSWALNVNGVGPEDLTIQPFSASGPPHHCFLHTFAKPGAVALQFIRVNGGEHKWFGHSELAASQTIDATTLIANFFQIPLSNYTPPVRTLPLPIVS